MQCLMQVFDSVGNAKLSGGGNYKDFSAHEK
jgi:hypothetical protein